MSRDPEMQSSFRRVVAGGSNPLINGLVPIRRNPIRRNANPNPNPKP